MPHCRENGGYHGQDPHLTLACSSRPLCLFSAGRCRLAHVLAMSYYWLHIKSPTWCSGVAEWEGLVAEMDLLHADCPGGGRDSNTWPAITRIKLGKRPFTPKTFCSHFLASLNPEWTCPLAIHSSSVSSVQRLLGARIFSLDDDALSRDVSTKNGKA